MTISIFCFFFLFLLYHCNFLQMQYTNLYFNFDFKNFIEIILKIYIHLTKKMSKLIKLRHFKFGFLRV